MCKKTRFTHAVAISACCLLSSYSAADNTNPGEPSLSRSTLLGVMPEQAGAGQNVVLENVVANSTATALGLRVGDEILTVNKQPIDDFQGLLQEVRKLPSGDSLIVEIKRGDDHLTLSGTMQPRPYETSDYAKVIYDSVSYPGNHLRSIIYKPNALPQGDTAPAIFFIQGYTCDSIDYGMIPTVTTKQLIDQFAEAGYVVFRVEKPGMGDSVSDRHCRDINFTEESNAFLQGLRTLKHKPYVDPSKVFLWGHSLGVLHAPVIAAQEKVAGIIGYGGVFKGWYDYMKDIYQKQSVLHWGASDQQANQNTKRVQPYLDLWLNTETPWTDVVKSPKVQQAISAELVDIDGEHANSRHYSFFRDLNRYNFGELWSALETPVLMMHGSLDIQAIEPKWAFDIANASAQPDSQAIVIEGAEHAFMRFKDQQEHLQARRDGEYNPGNPQQRFDPRVAEQTLRWLAKF